MSTKIEITSSGGGGGGGDTDLSYIPAVSQGTVTSSTGTDATIPLADATNAGLFTATEKTKLAGLSNVNLTEGTGINITGAYPSLTIAATGVSSASILEHDVKYGVALTKGQAVYVTSADGTNMIVSKASNVSDAESSKTMGLVTSTGPQNGKGTVITEGLLSNIDTSAANNEGDPVWLGIDGNLLYGLAYKPVAPAHLVFIGIVTRKNVNTGEIFIKVQNGFELEELHNVLINGSLANNNILTYESSTLLWKNKTVAAALGYTAENITNKATDFTTINNTLYPTVQAVNTHIDQKLVGLWDDRGSYDASGGNYPTVNGSGTGGAILKGDIWTVNVPGTIYGIDVHIGDTIRALDNIPGQTPANWALLENAIGYVPENVVNKRTTFQATPTDTAYPSEKLVKDNLDLKANLASPTFTGTPTLPTGTIGYTQTAGDNTTKLATTAFVTTAVNANSSSVASLLYFSNNC